jgi:hypothetical protein
MKAPFSRASIRRAVQDSAADFARQLAFARLRKTHRRRLEALVSRADEIEIAEIKTSDPRALSEFAQQFLLCRLMLAAAPDLLLGMLKADGGVAPADDSPRSIARWRAIRLLKRQAGRAA